MIEKSVFGISISEPNVIEMIGKLGAQDMARKLRLMAFRQEALEKALAETTQALHDRCHGHLHLSNWRDCFMEPCSKLRALHDASVFLGVVDVVDVVSLADESGR